MEPIPKLEEEIFKRSNPNYRELEKYGFIKKNNNYTYTKPFLNNKFKAIITIDIEGKITGEVIDNEFNEAYQNFRIKSQTGKFISKVKEEYQNILIDIKNNCFNNNYFLLNQTNNLTNYILKTYHDKPEFLWSKFPYHGVFRNQNNQKWYAIIMTIDKAKLTKENGQTEIINLKLPKEKIKKLLTEKGYYKAYHMNSSSWITIILDNTIESAVIEKLIDESYNIINT